MPLKILISAPVCEDGRARLRQLNDLEVEWVPQDDEAENAKLASSAEVVFIGKAPATFDCFPALKWLQLESAGYDFLIPHRLGRRGVSVTNARGIFDIPIAEWNIAMMINLLRDLRGMIRNQENAHWDRSSRFQRELRGLTVGLWGYGGIGRETARLARCLGMNVHVLSRSGAAPGVPGIPSIPRNDCYTLPGTGDPEGTLPDRFFSLNDKAAFLGSIDFLILALPLTASTRGMVGEAELAALRRGAFLLNPSRGPIVQEQALLAALRSGHLGGAALDTHYHYPMPPDHPLWAMPQVIMTPHISGSTGSPFFLIRLWELFATNLQRYQRGETLLNRIAPGDLT